jgi:hypothetical protein
MVRTWRDAEGYLLQWMEKGIICFMVRAMCPSGHEIFYLFAGL